MPDNQYQHAWYEVFLVEALAKCCPLRSKDVDVSDGISWEGATEKLFYICTGKEFEAGMQGACNE